MEINEAIEAFIKSGPTNRQFTKEGIMLGTFKLAIENNAMLKVLINMVSKIYAELPPNPNVDGKEYEFNEMRKEFEKACVDLSQVVEHLSTKSAYDFAVDHDSSLGGDELITMPSGF